MAVQWKCQTALNGTAVAPGDIADPVALAQGTRAVLQRITLIPALRLPIPLAFSVHWIRRCVIVMAALFALCVSRQATAQYISGPAAGAGARPGPPPCSVDGVPLADLLEGLAQDRLSPGQIRSAVVAALQNQADLKTNWDPQWGDFAIRHYQILRTIAESAYGPGFCAGSVR